MIDRMSATDDMKKGSLNEMLTLLGKSFWNATDRKTDIKRNLLLDRLEANPQDPDGIRVLGLWQNMMDNAKVAVNKSRETQAERLERDKNALARRLGIAPEDVEKTLRSAHTAQYNVIQESLEYMGVA